MEQLLFAPLAAFVLALAAGPLAIPLLRRWKLGQAIRSQGPARHLGKAGTPTMGGIMILAALTGAVLLFAPWDGFLFLALLTTVGFGILGFMDDFLKVVLHRPLGLKARSKLAGQVFLGLVLAWGALGPLGLGSKVSVPFVGAVLDLGPAYVAFVLLVVIGSANAVNLTDGLDGLAAGLSVIAYFSYAVFSLAVGQPGLAVFALAMVGAAAGFLRYNLHPARVFMGDTGALALGGGLGALAVLTKTELLLPLVGGVFVLETLSVMVQVMLFRVTGKRILRMSPLHHHFELLGWAETQVVHRFWLVGLVCAFLGFLGLAGLGTPGWSG